MSRRTARALTISSLESLEDRCVLSTTATGNAWEAVVTSVGGPTLGAIYTEYYNYVASGSQGLFYSPYSHTVEMIGPTVGVQFQFTSGSFASNEALMKGAGLVETAAFPTANVLEGFMPIAQLPAIAPDPNIGTLTAVMRPVDTPVINTAPSNPNVTIVTELGGAQLGSVYQEYLNYEAAGGTGTFSPTEASSIYFNGTSVGVDIRSTPANFNAMLGAMEVYGMQVTATVPQIGLIEGFLPIAQLPTVLTNADLVSLVPIYKAQLQ